MVSLECAFAENYRGLCAAAIQQLESITGKYKHSIPLDRWMAT